MEDRIITALRRSNRVLVTTHVKPDGDALGSLIAMSFLLEAMGKTVVCVNEGPLPAVYQFLPGIERIIPMSPADTFDTLVVLDCSDLERIGGVIRYLPAIPVVINIDHHMSNTHFGTLTCVDVEACATAEIVYRLIKRCGVAISPKMAMGIYTGIFTDTGSFRFANTNRSSFFICNEMVMCGVDPYTVARRVYGTYSMGRIKLLNMALDSIELAQGGRLSFMVVTRDMLRETDTHPEDADGMINYAKRIESVLMAVMIQEDPDQEGRYYISLRSDGAVDVSVLAIAHGGGGHVRAAGFSRQTTLAELKRLIADWFFRHDPGPEFLG